MEQQAFISGLSGLRKLSSACVVTIGSFDGVHLGHQQILARLVTLAKAQNVPSAVVIFEPQPHEYFAKQSVRPRLMRLREKVQALFAEGINYVVCLRFNAQLRNLSAEAFIAQVLVEGLNVRHLEVGDDFRFGCDRQGDFDLLQQAGESLGFSVSKSQTFIMGGERVSSTRIRQLLSEQALTAANELLGKPYTIAGRVIYGNQLGRTIGVPTANIGLGRYHAALGGVYAVKVTLDRHVYNGVANVGIKPTIAGIHKPMLEVHIFDFHRNLYGQFISVEFCAMLRAEKKFDSIEQLVAQIQQDCANAQCFFDAPTI
ncbi:bifunctional riboflavin kinase/FAD synthetase [Marinagarivorans algicola]|uniref:bifunctional riboflavin kinase/FAD synthetase n=1 Tax=Marinagarivorans algicola TaxID=1513270 RepID=UPI0006B42885|nr:bifunctional riboflavin kinase/FAD synthetase [Marinagarivorans algicola]